MNARISRRKRQPPRQGHFYRNLILFGLALGVASFLIAYGATALSFANDTAPSDVVLVPDVRRMETEEALQAMERAGLTVQVGDSFPNPDIPAGGILTQSPLPGQEVAPGTEVRLIKSTGRRRPRVPDVSAMPVGLATRAIEAAGFAVAIEEELAEGDSGRVVMVTPPAGTPLELPDTVLLQLGGAVTYIAMPTFIGMLEEPARQAAEALGLSVGPVIYDPSEFGEPGGVVAQQPAPGDSVALGSEIEFRVTAPRGGRRSVGRDDRDRFRDSDDGDDFDRRDEPDRPGGFDRRDRFDRGPNSRGRFR